MMQAFNGNRGCNWGAAVTQPYDKLFQVPRWIGIFFGTIFRNSLTEPISYIVAVFLTFYLFSKFVTNTLRHLMEKSTISCILLGAVPFIYYIFDYTTTVYTDWLYSGVRGVLWFMPSIFTIFYFVFGILYILELQKQMNINRERDMLAAQLHGTQTELSSLRQMHQAAAAYRHDMRHHFAMLQGMAAEGNLEKMKAYMKMAQTDIESISPIRYCENETLNLILSTFSNRASQAGVVLTVEVSLPDRIPLRDTELCALLSNGLENAIYAASSYPDAQNRFMAFKAMVQNDSLLLLIENPYGEAVVMKDGLPQSAHGNHSYGVRSIAAIVNSHGGQVLFNTENEIFRLKILIPLMHSHPETGEIA